MAPFPTQQEIHELASSLSTTDPSPFFNRVSQNVIWDILGDHPAAGHFTDFESWKKGAVEGANRVLSAPLKLNVINVIGGGDQAWACLELEAVDAFGKNGMPYPQKYSWLLRFDEEGSIAHVRVYGDTKLVQKLFDTNS